MKLFPDIEQEVERIVGMTDLKRVAVFEAVLLEAEQVEVLAVEISVELVAGASEAALVKMVPYGCHRLDILHMVEPVVKHAVQIFVDGKEADGFQIGQYVVAHDVLHLFFCRESIIEERFDVVFIKLLDGNQHLWGIQQHVGMVEVRCHYVLECLAQVNGHCDACLHDVWLIDDGLCRVRRIERGE